MPAAVNISFGNEETTLTIPSTAEKVISVGAYDARYRQLADFSGRGFTRQTNRVKPFAHNIPKYFPNKWR